MSLPPYQLRNLMLPVNLGTLNFVQSWNFAQSLSYYHQGHLSSTGGSPTNPKMFTNQPKDGYLNKEVYYRFEIWHLHITHKVTTAMDGYLLTLGWSFTNPRMVTNQPEDGHLNKEVYYRLRIWHLNIIHKTNTRWQLPWMVTYHPYDGCSPTQGWSPTNLRIVTNQKEV